VALLQFRSIQDLYERLRDELVELMNLFYRDREMFIQEVISRADNEISVLNILAFDPSSPDSVIAEVDEDRLLFFVTKERYFKRWSEHSRLQYLVMGINDNFTVFAYHIRGEVSEFYRDVLDRALDIYMFDNDDRGRIILPYNVPVRVQGDVVVVRRRELGIGMAEEVLLELSGDLTNQDIDRLLDSISDRVRFTTKQRAAIKLKYKARRRMGKSTAITIRNYVARRSVLAQFDGDSRDYYRLALSWIGGASHLIEYYGLRPVLAPWRDRVYVKVLGEELRIIHGSHIPVVLKVRPGDVLEFRLLEQRHERIPNEMFFVQVDPGQPPAQDFDRAFATLIYLRYIDRLGSDGFEYHVFRDAARRGIDYVVDEMIRHAGRTVLRYAFRRFNMENVRQHLRNDVITVFSNAVNNIKQMVGEDRVLTPIGEFAAYVHYMVGMRDSVKPIGNAIAWFRDRFESDPDYETAVVENNAAKLAEVAHIGRTAEKIMNKVLKMGFAWRAYLVRWRSSDPGKFYVQLICVNNEVCVEL